MSSICVSIMFLLFFAVSLCFCVRMYVLLCNFTFTFYFLCCIWLPSGVINDNLELDDSHVTKYENF